MNKIICNLANLLWPHRLTNRLSAFDSSAHNNNAVSFLKNLMVRQKRFYATGQQV